MPIKKAQAKNKQAVLAEIQATYKGASPHAPPRIWQDQNFNFAQPSDVWLGGVPQLAALNVQLKYRNSDSKFDVILKAKTANGEVTTNVGTIKEG